MVKFSIGNPSKGNIIDSKKKSAKEVKKMTTSKGKMAQKITTTVETITFESVLGSECRTWWEQAEANHPLKKALCTAKVDKIIFMPIFELKEFEPILRNLITRYEASSHKSIVQHFQQQVIVSYSAEEISRVFKIPNRGQEVEKSSLTIEDKKKWLKLMCQKDLTSLEWERILKNSRGLKKIFIANDECPVL